MNQPLSERLRENIPEIMNQWVIRADQEVDSAKYHTSLALKNSLPDYLQHLADALSQTIVRSKSRGILEKVKGMNLGKKHGHERAGMLHYTIDQLIMEYHILRQVICDVLEQKKLLDSKEREIIVCSIEQAVNDSATQFNKSLQELQEHLTQTLAHDLRNPLSAARLGVQMISRKPEDHNLVLHKSLNVIHSIDRVDRMIRDLLDVSRLKAGELLPLKYTTFDLKNLAETVCHEMNKTYPGRFSVEANGECLGQWDKTSILRVLENLLENALKYGATERPILITISQNEFEAKVTVHNEGNPIPIEEQKILFQHNWRSETSQKAEGWGLGLTVVKAMVEAHSGTIELESDEKSGTSFIFTLPKKEKSFSQTH